ncbi:hypothetical protein LWI28_005640 [Acer negundo]|uniref:Hepcidin n=1 Tax=Acer negundo TaxID=4023 RepID=A0AAD5ITV6_ACENE|nr:hypothetical protein LWI28_005640 [Acer negundo]
MSSMNNRSLCCSSFTLVVAVVMVLFVQEMENMTTEIRLKKIWQNLRLPTRSNNTLVSANRCCCRMKCWKPKC